MTVSVLGGLLGILMMIPLRRAFIVKQHGKLLYPEGTACAEVLVAGEKGGATAQDGVRRLRHRLRPQVPDRRPCKLWSGEPAQQALHRDDDGTKIGLKGARGQRRAVARAAGRRLPDRPAHRLPDDGRGGAVVLRPRPADRHVRRERSTDRRSHPADASTRGRPEDERKDDRA